jgi:hypothetical protein
MLEKEKLEIIAQKLDNKKKRLEIAKAQKEFLMENKKMILDQINSLRNLITETILDEDKTILASEPKIKSVFSEDEIKKMKKKIWSLIEKLE